MLRPAKLTAGRGPIGRVRRKTPEIDRAGGHGFGAIPPPGAHSCSNTRARQPGRTTGACPGYVVDHIVPLKRGGADDVEHPKFRLCP